MTNLPTLHSNTALSIAPVDMLAEEARYLWLECRKERMPLERADALVFESTASGLAAAKILSKYVDITQPRSFVRSRGYFVARLLSVHERSVVLMTADTQTHRVSRGLRHRTESSVEFTSTYKRAVPGHYMFRRSEDGHQIKRVCAIPADYLR